MKEYRVTYPITSFVNVYVFAEDEDEAIELADQEVKKPSYNREILENCKLEDGEAEEEKKKKMGYAIAYLNPPSPKYNNIISPYGKIL